jgi:AraC family transcriptional regulator, regulatory protein of adaptative response / methylated-DNA-[protein]-cysteine methyltransferase
MVHLYHPDDPDTIPYTLALEDDARWSAMLDRDTTGTGPFVIAVASTGIYCRVGCPARRPLRENVRFFATIDEARGGGFRACKRCHPDEDPALRTLGSAG